jgi:GxxExxY protein
MLRVASPLDAELEALIHRVIGCCISVHRGLGPGLRERMYVRALRIELELAGIPYEVERRFTVTYRGRPLCIQRVDLIVSERLILEVKSVDRLAPVHIAQTRTYLRIAKLRAGLVLNFNVAVLPDGLRRIVL